MFSNKAVVRRCEKLPVSICRSCILRSSCACLNFAARSWRKLRPISGDMWFTAIASIGEQQGLHRTPSWLFSRRRFFPNSFRRRTCATSPLRIGSCKSVPFQEQPGSCVSVCIGGTCLCSPCDRRRRFFSMYSNWSAAGEMLRRRRNL